MNTRIEALAARPPDAPLPYVRVTSVGGVQISYEMKADELRVWSITQE